MREPALPSAVKIAISTREFEWLTLPPFAMGVRYIIVTARLVPSEPAQWYRKADKPVEEDPWSVLVFLTASKSCQNQRINTFLKGY